jgi:hypothetical protein
MNPLALILDQSLFADEEQPWMGWGGGEFYYPAAEAG